MGYVPRDTSPINAGPHVVEDAGPLHENIKFTMEEKGNGELAFLGTLLKRNNGGILYWYIGSLHILTNTYTTARTTKQVAREVLFPPCLIEHIPLSQIKMTYAKKTLELSKC